MIGQIGLIELRIGLIELGIVLIDLVIGLIELGIGLMELWIGLRINKAWRTVLARVSGLVFLLGHRFAVKGVIQIQFFLYRYIAHCIVYWFVLGILYIIHWERFVFNARGAS